MSKLHLISQPIDLEQFKIDLNRMITADDEMLFIGDGVINLMDENITTLINQATIQFYGLASDCLCRGIDQLLNKSMTQISDQLMVELTIKHQQIISW